jgi:hypothetical protein
MKRRSLLTLLVLTLTVALAGAQAGSAHDRYGKRHGANDLVFVQTNELTGNRILVYDVARDGNLRSDGSYATGGNGGAALPGTESDRLGSQGSLVYDRHHRLLVAVNAGSNSVSTFSVHGSRLRLEGVVPSGGQFPASIAVHGNLVYVLNAAVPESCRGSGSGTAGCMRSPTPRARSGSPTRIRLIS